MAIPYLEFHKLERCESKEELLATGGGSLYQRYTIGDMVVVWLAAPEYGRLVYKVTRKDDNGLYGILVEEDV